MVADLKVICKSIIIISSMASFYLYVHFIYVKAVQCGATRCCSMRRRDQYPFICGLHEY